MKYIALICARGGSKGIPDKNIRLLGNKPLIAWAIQSAKQVKRIARVIVSTDSERIAAIAKKYQAEVPFIRPADLAADDSPEWMVWRHALDYLNDTEKENIDGLVIIPATAPLRNAIDINNCLNEYEKGDVDVVITVSPASRNPYFNMVTIDNDKNVSLVIPPKSNIFRRQDAPKVYDVTTVAYVVRPDFIQQKEAIFEGRVRCVEVPCHRSLDIDTEFDFNVAESLMEKKIGESIENN